MTYNPDNARERKKAESGTIVDAVIVHIKDGTVKDFVKADNIKDFKHPESLAIYVTSEGKFDDRIQQCETLFTYEMVNGVMEFDWRSNLAYFKTQYGVLPKIGLKVKHIANAKGYFKLLVKV